MSEADNSTPNAGAFKPKKSVALSGVTAGNTACVPLAAPAMTCTIAATTSSTWPGRASLKKSPTC